MLKAFFDDSGTSPSNRVAVVAGYIANTYHWERFNAQWKVLLCDYGVKLLRRSDLEWSKGQYVGWNDNLKREFLQRAHGIIKRYTDMGIATSVIKDDFERIIPKGIKTTLGGAYGWCVRDCLMKVEQWCDKKKYKGRVFYVFEAGTRGQGQIDIAMRLFYRNPEYRRRFRLQGWTFYDKSMIPLQAADLLAYEVFKTSEERYIKKSKRDFRPSAAHLFKNADLHLISCWEEPHIKKWLLVWTKNHRDLASSMEA